MGAFLCLFAYPACFLKKASWEQRLDMIEGLSYQRIESPDPGLDLL
ncbi:MAG: hypothetical protein R3B47_09755 [Bacteroidia bacterium]